MSRRGAYPRTVAACLLVTAASSVAGSPDARAQDPADLYRRSPLVGGDPFAGLTEQRSSLSLKLGASGENSALGLNDLGAILFLAERDSLRPTDALDALGLVPRGHGLTGYGAGEIRLRAGLLVARAVTVGVGLQGRGYGSFRIDDDAVALLRDGNDTRSEFTLGRTRGDGLVTAEAGVHAVWRAVATEDGSRPRLTIGAGIRYVEPLFYGRALSVLEDVDPILVSGDSVRAHIELTTARSPSVGAQGSGWLGDLMARIEWPSAGAALEATVQDFGRVHVDGLVLRSEEVDLATTRLDDVVDVVDSLSLTVRDTVAATVSPPVLVGLTASVWAWAPVQLDGRLLLPVGGDFDRPPATAELLATWRPVRRLPLRTGVRLGGRGGVGVRLGLGWETSRFFVRGSAVSNGGFAGNARGLAAGFETGVWF